MTEKHLSIHNENCNSQSTVVFLSGLFAGGWMWDKTVESEHFKQNKLIVFENPLVDYTDGKRNIETIVQKVGELLINAKVQKNIHFVGNSLGSLIGLLLSQNKSFNTLKIVLSGCPCRNNNISIGAGTVMTPNADFLKTLRSKLFFDPTVIGDDLVDKILESTYTRANFVKILKILKELETFSINPCLEETSLPIKLIWGENDNVTPLCHWEDTPTLNPLISIATIAECGHSPMLEKPIQFNEILDRYINA